MIEFIINLILLGLPGDEVPVGERITGYVTVDAPYVLIEMDGRSDVPAATVEFSSDGRISGNAPCNIWSAEQTAPYPWFEASPIATTRRSCPDMSGEVAFLAALEEVTFAEVSGDVLILSNDLGATLVFALDR